MTAEAVPAQDAGFFGGAVSRFPARRVIALTILIVCLVQLVAILVRTHGNVLFTLDDPYIHLALAEHIAHGLHYGINSGEFSAPASSIIYPFLLAPLVALGLGQYSALLICVGATIASGVLACEILVEAGYRLNALPAGRLVFLALVFCIGTNLVGLAFTGLEHSLQVAVSLGCVLGLHRFLKTGQAAWPWLVIIVLAPLVRYENASFWIGCVAALAWRGRARVAAVAGSAGIAALGGFSLWLHGHGLPYLPSSVLAKFGAASPTSQVQALGHGLGSLLCDVKGFVASGVLFGVARCWKLAILSLACATLAALGLVLLAVPGLPTLRTGSGFVGAPGPQDGLGNVLAWKLVDPVLQDGLLQLVILALLLAAALPRLWKTRDYRIGVAAFGIFVIAAHLAAGQMGWFCRYQVYVVVTGIIALAVVGAPDMADWLHTAEWPRFGAVLLAFLAVMSPFVWCTLHTTQAAGNIYDQQFQMRRFVTEFHHGAVAVNDIGEVGFGNRAYVLDLWGLASEPARQARLSRAGVHWMAALATERHAGLAMMYDQWFPAVPAGWIKMATLTSQRPQYTTGEPDVAFYATDACAAPAIESELLAFATTLPASDKLLIAQTPVSALGGACD